LEYLISGGIFYVQQIGERIGSEDHWIDFFVCFLQFIPFRGVFFMPKCAVISLGCPKNLVDSEQMLGLLRQDGFEPCYDVENAEIVIINTCGFLAASREEGLENIHEMEALREDPDLPEGKEVAVQQHAIGLRQGAAFFSEPVPAQLGFYIGGKAHGAAVLVWAFS